MATCPSVVGVVPVRVPAPGDGAGTRLGDRLGSVLARTLGWIGVALTPLALAALVILRWDTAQRMVEARAEADRSAEALARNLDATVGMAMKQIRALADSDELRTAYASGDREALGRETHFLRHHPSWLGAAILDERGHPLVRRGVVPDHDLVAPPGPGQVEFLRRSGTIPPMVVVSAPVGPAEREAGRLIGIYSLQDLETAIASASDRSGLLLVARPDGTVVLGPLDNLGSTLILTPSRGNLMVHLEDREALSAVAPAAGGTLRAIALRISLVPGRSALPALGGLAAAGALVVVFIVGWQLRLGQMVRRLREREEELATLNELATDATVSGSAGQVIQMAGARAARLFDADRSFVALVEGGGSRVDLHRTFPTPTDAPIALTPPGNPALARTLRHGRREMGSCQSDDPGWSAALASSGWECWTPLVAHGRIFGALGLICDKPRMDLTTEEERLLDGIAATLAVSLESHQRLAEVAEQRAMLAAVVDSSPDGLLALDETARIILDNPAARHLLQQDRPVTGTSLPAVLEGVERGGSHFEWDFDPEVLLALSREGQTTRGSFRLRHDGHLRRMESVMAPLPLPLGAKGTLVAMRDVTERAELAIVRRLHQRVSVLARQASARAALLEQVLAAADVGMAFLGADRVVSWENRLFGELLGLQTEARGKTLSQMEQEIRQAVEEGFTGLAPGAHLLHTRQPDSRILAMRTVYVQDEQGDEVGLLVSVRDETAQRELAQAREQFIGIAAHELKNPLAVLRIQAELGLKDEKRRADALQRILLRASQLQELIDRLLDATRAELGRLQLDFSAVDLLSLASDAAEPFLAQGAPIRVSGVEGLSIQADAVRLKQLLGNLISNAVRYGGEGQIDVTVGIRGDQAFVGVKDRGPGIPFEEQKSIFDRFGQGRAARKGQGLGLGLFLAQRIAEAHGGTIELKSAPGQGSTFTLLLPTERSQGA